MLHFLKFTSPVLVAALLLTGCGGGGSGDRKTFKTTGVVKVNDRAIEGAIVTFVPESGNNSGIGSTDKEGKFEISTFAPADGAMEGTYNVEIKKVDVEEVKHNLQQGVIASGELDASYTPPTATTGGGGGAKPKSSPIPEKYGNSQTSGLRAVVSPSGPNHFEFNLK